MTARAGRRYRFVMPKQREWSMIQAALSSEDAP